MSALDFKMMAFAFKIRDFFRPRLNIVKEVGIREGFRVLDYGCGPGSYVAAVAGLVGSSGRLYALDINPLAIKMVEEIVAKKQLLNVETILSGRETGLPDSSLDVVLLYDTFHNLSEPDRAMEELHRVLKSNGVLSFSDHHLKENEVASRVANNRLFRLLRKGERTYSFAKEETT